MLQTLGPGLRHSPVARDQMDQLRKQTDLSRERPSRRSWLPARRPTKAIGKHRRAFPRLRRTKPAAEVRVARVVDLHELEGDPTYRADQGLLKFGAEIHPLRGHVRVEIETPTESRQGIAMTVVILLGMGAVLGACGFAACDFWRLPPAFSAGVTILMFVSPVITYLGLRRRG